MLGRQDGERFELLGMDGQVVHAVELPEKHAVLHAALPPSKRRLAVAVVGGEPRAGGGFDPSGAPQVLVFDLPEGRCLRRLPAPSAEPAWFPSGEKLAVSTGTGITVLTLADGTLTALHEFSKTPQGSTRLQVSPGGEHVAFLKLVGNSRRVGIVDVAAGEGSTFPDSCFDASWWDDHSVLYRHGSVLKILDIGTGEARTFLRDLTPLRRSGALERACPRWEALLSRAPESAHHEISAARHRDGRAWLAIRITGRGPFSLSSLFGSREQTLCGVMSVDETGGDPRLEYEGEQGKVDDLAFADGGRVLMVRFERWDADRRATPKWLAAGKARGAVPEGCGVVPAGMRGGPGGLDLAWMAGS